MAKNYHVPAFPNPQTSGDSYTVIFDNVRKVKPGPTTTPTDRNRNQEALHKNVASADASSNKAEPQAPKPKVVSHTRRPEAPLHHNSAAQRVTRQQYIQQGSNDKSQAKPVTRNRSNPSLQDKIVTSKEQRHSRSTGGSIRISNHTNEAEEQDVIVPPFPSCNEPNLDYSDVFIKARKDLISPLPYPTGRERDKRPGLKWYNIVGRCIHWFSKCGTKSRPVNTYKKV